MAAPIVLLSNPGMQCLTFFWKEHPHYWVGYRVSEGLPEMHPHSISVEAICPSTGWGPFPAVTGDLIPSKELSLPRKRWRAAYREKDPRNPTQLEFQSYHDGSAWCTLWEGNGQQLREFWFQPVDDGVQMWMRLTTKTPIVGVYLVPQCLRFTGAQNWSLRRQIALVPFLSELDLQAMGHPELTLTYARTGDEWLHFPVRESQYATPLASSLDGHVVSGKVDHGPIARETLDRKMVPASYFRRTAPGETWERISSGLYWERTAWISNRHPADCVHAVIDLGPLAAGGSRTVHGKFYWIEGTKDNLFAAWQRDFDQ